MTKKIIFFFILVFVSIELNSMETVIQALESGNNTNIQNVMRTYDGGWDFNAQVRIANVAPAPENNDRRQRRLLRVRPSERLVKVPDAFSTAFSLRLLNIQDLEFINPSNAQEERQMISFFFMLGVRDNNQQLIEWSLNRFNRGSSEANAFASELRFAINHNRQNALEHFFKSNRTIQRDFFKSLLKEAVITANEKMFFWLLENNRLSQSPNDDSALSRSTVRTKESTDQLIHDAVWGGSIAIIHALLYESKGVEASIRQSLNSYDSKGRNVLHLACIKGDTEMIMYILRQEAASNLKREPERQNLNMDAAEYLFPIEYLWYSDELLSEVDPNSFDFAPINSHNRSLPYSHDERKRSLIAYMLDQMKISDFITEYRVISDLLLMLIQNGWIELFGWFDLNMSEISRKLKISQEQFFSGDHRINREEYSRWNDRSPLKIALLSNRTEVAIKLLERGARVVNGEGEIFERLQPQTIRSESRLIMAVLNALWREIKEHAWERKYNAGDGGRRCQNYLNDYLLLLLPTDKKRFMDEVLEQVIKLNQEELFEIFDEIKRSAEYTGTVNIPILLNEGPLACSQESVDPSLFATYANLPVSLDALRNRNASLESVTSNDGFEVTHLAAMNGHVEVLKLLGEWGIDMNSTSSNDMTPLMVAASHGQIRAVCYLMSFVGQEWIFDRDKDRNSAIHLALMNGHEGVAEFLVNMTSDFDEKDKVSILSHQNDRGQTIAHLCAKKGYCSLLERVITLKPDLEAIRDKKGKTVLSYGSGCPAIVYFLTHAPIDHARTEWLADNDTGLRQEHRNLNRTQIIQRLLENNFILGTYQ